MTAGDTTSWMPLIDTAHAVTIPVPTAAETVITNPRIPGLELHIPSSTVLRNHENHVVTAISLTPIPLDRTPFPLPPNVKVPLYFTAQPGGSYLYNPQGAGARLIYPNTYQRPVGTPFDFWDYDPDEKGWYVYGQGQVQGAAIGNSAEQSYRLPPRTQGAVPRLQRDCLLQRAENHLGTPKQGCQQPAPRCGYYLDIRIRYRGQAGLVFEP